MSGRPMEDQWQEWLRASSTDTPSAVCSGNALEYNEDNMGDTQHPTIYPTNAPFIGLPSFGCPPPTPPDPPGYRTKEDPLCQRDELSQKDLGILRAGTSVFYANGQQAPKPELSTDSKAALKRQIKALRKEAAGYIAGRDNATVKYRRCAEAIDTLNHRIAMIERDLA